MKQLREKVATCTWGIKPCPEVYKKRKTEGNEGSKKTPSLPVLQRSGQARLNDVGTTSDFLQNEGLAEVFALERNRAKKWNFVSLR